MTSNVSNVDNKCKEQNIVEEGSNSRLSFSPEDEPTNTYIKGPDPP